MMPGKKTMRAFLLIVTALALAGCVPNNVRQGDAAVFDFGEGEGGWNAPSPRGVDVVAPVWLGSAAMQYRLAYSEPARRRAYVDSRWAAAPAELLEQELRRRALAGGTAASACRLRVDIDEFAQVFASEQSSRIVLAVRAMLLSRNEQVVASRAIKLERPAASADARGGVAAAAAAVQGLAGELAGWIAQEKSALAARCQE